MNDQKYVHSGSLHQEAMSLQTVPPHHQGIGEILSFIIIEENIFYAWFLFITVSLPTHFPRHFSTVCLNQTFQFTHEASISVFRFVSAIHPIIYLTQMILCHTKMYFLLRYIMQRSPTVFLSCVLPETLRYLP